MKTMQKEQKMAGFTLIELIAVIVILGILAAVAVPRYVSLQSDAEQAAAEGIAGNIASASAINYGVCAARGTSDSNCIAATACTTAVVTALVPDFNTSDYSVATGSAGDAPFSLVSSADGSRVACSVNVGSGS